MATSLVRSLFLILLAVTCFAGAANAAQYLGIADNASTPLGGVRLWDISATTPTLVDTINIGTTNGGFYGIAFGPNNDVFVTTMGSRDIYRAAYEGNGQWADAWTVAFTVPTYAGNAIGLAYDPVHNRMHVSTPSQGRDIYRWDFNTEELGSDYVDLGTCYGLSVVGDKLWMAFNAAYIGRLDTTTGIREAMNSTVANPDWPNAPGGSTFGVCGAPDGSTGSAYYTGGVAIWKYEVNSVADWDRTNNHYTVWKQDPTHLVGPLGIVVGTDRNSDGVRDFFVADQNWGEWPNPRVNPPRVVIYSGSDGAYLGTFADTSAVWFGEPRYMAVTSEPPAQVAAATIQEAKLCENGTIITMTGKATTCNRTELGGAIYVEETDRSSGIKLVPATVNGTVVRGSIVDVQGTIKTSAAGERYLDGATVDVKTGSNVIAPLGMTNKSTGGGTEGTPADNGKGYYGPAGGVGTNNVGLLVRVWGNVVDSGSNYVTIDDGSGTNVDIDTTYAPATPTSGYITVTGISTLFGTKPNVTRQVLARP